MVTINECPVCGSSSWKLWLRPKDYFLTGEEFPIMACEDCGMKVTSPQPEPEKLGAYYHSAGYISHTDGKTGIFHKTYQWVRKFTLSQKAKLVELQVSKGKILDIGCATGHFLQVMQSHHWEIAGIEPDAKTREYAQKHLGTEIFDEGQLDLLPDSAFDAISLWHVLEHVPDLNQRVEQIKRLLKPRGAVFVALPNHSAYDARHYREFWAGYDVPRHLHHFVPFTVQALFAKHGFKLTGQIPMRFDSYYVSLLSEKYQYGKSRILNAIWTGWKSNMVFAPKYGFSSHIYVFKPEYSKRDD